VLTQFGQPFVFFVSVFRAGHVPHALSVGQNECEASLKDVPHGFHLFPTLPAHMHGSRLKSQFGMPRKPVGPNRRTVSRNLLLVSEMRTQAVIEDLCTSNPQHRLQSTSIVLFVITHGDQGAEKKLLPRALL
jgi:hypothetical protein